MYSIILWSCPFLDNVFIIPTNLQVLNWWTNCSLKLSSSDFLLLLGQHNNKKHSVKWDEDQERERFSFHFTFTSFHLSICFMCFHFFSSSLWLLKRFIFFSIFRITMDTVNLFPWWKLLQGCFFKNNNNS